MTTVELPAGAFDLVQAKAAGIGGAEVRRQLRAGRWMRLGRGLFVQRDRWDELGGEGRHLLLAHRALELAPPGAVLSHVSASVVHGLQRLEPWRPTLPTVTATVPRTTRVNRSTRFRLHRADLPEPDLCASTRATAVARTVVDLARSLPLDAGTVLADSALRQGLCTVDELREVYGRCRIRPGALAAGRTVYFADPACESPLESVVRVALHEQGLPPPRTQVEVALGTFTYRLDFLFEAQRTVVEADGLDKYTEPEVLREEKLREDRLREAGFEVVRVTWGAVRRNPGEFADRVRSAFARAEARR